MSKENPKHIPQDKGLPVNVDAERFVLGSILLDDSLLPNATRSITADDFSLEKHRRIFKRMVDLNERGEHIDRITVATELQRFNELESVDGLSYLVSLDDGLPQIPNINSYVRLVREKSLLRQVVFNSQHLINRAMLGEELPTDIVNDARETFMGLTIEDASAGPKNPGQIVEEAGGVTRFLGPPERGITTGFVKYDEMTGGLHPGELTILAARPSVGKTAFAMNIASYVAVKQRKTVMVFSLEMSKAQLLLRIVCAAARVDIQRVRLGYLNHEERGRLNIALADIMDAPLLIDDTSAVKFADFHARVRQQKKTGGVDLVIVDYLQLMEAGRKFENKNQEVTYLSRGMKLMAGEMGIPMYVLSQLSRAVETRKGGGNRPQLSDLRESGAIEQDADVVTFLFREELYSRDREDLRGLAEAIIAKQRNGPIGTVKLIFLNHITKFENRTEDVGSPDEGGLLA